MFCVDPPHLEDRKNADIELVLETISSFTNSSPAKHNLVKWRWYSGEEERSAQA